MERIEDHGGGTPIVLLHPFPFSRGLWAGLAETLAAHRPVLAIDARGFGESPLPPGGAYSVDDLADDVAAVLDELSIERVTLLGMSMGGYTALAFAVRHPTRLGGLILADTRAAADNDETRAARAAALKRIDEAGPDAYLAGSLARLLAPEAPPALVAHLRARAERRAPSLRAGIAALRDRPDRSSPAVLGAIHCPTLVICGEADAVVPAAEMRGLADAIPGARFVAIPGAGHLPHVEAPGAFQRAVATMIPRAEEARA
jgi:3-oxoadipate enol-lactonase